MSKALVAMGGWIAVLSFGLTAINELGLPWGWQFLVMLAFTGVTMRLWQLVDRGLPRPPTRAILVACLISFAVMPAVALTTGVRGLAAGAVFSAIALLTFLGMARWQRRTS